MIAYGFQALMVVTGVAALTAFLTEPLSADARGKLALDSVTVVGVALMVVWYFVLGPSLSGSGAREQRDLFRLLVIATRWAT